MRRLASLLTLVASVACGPGLGGDRGLDQDLGIRSDGYDDPAGSGPVFFVEDYLPTADQRLSWAMDIDDDGDEDRTINLLAERYQLLGVDFSEFVRSGALLGVIELAGIEEAYSGEDDGVTLKIYKTQDADRDLGNNTCSGDGCARFEALDSYMEDGQTLFRFGPEAIVDHHLRLELDQVPDRLVEVGGDIQLPFYKGRFELEIPDRLDSITQGVACGAVPAWAAHTVPICAITDGTWDEDQICTEDQSLAFMVARLGAQPDIDLDDDGLETYEVDFAGEVLRCHDADGTVIEGPECLSDPRMADGFSLCASFRGIPAELVVP